MPSIVQSGLADGDIASDFIAAASIAVEDAIDALSKAARRTDFRLRKFIAGGAACCPLDVWITANCTGAHYAG